MQRLLIATLTFVWLVLSLSAEAKAEPLYALTLQSSGAGLLLGFDSANPSALTSSLQITGVGGRLRGLDFRPSLGPNNGVLYGIADELVPTPRGELFSYRIYTIDVQTGVATRGAILTYATSGEPVLIQGNFFGMDFNPTTDRLHVVGQAGQNWQVDVDTGVIEVGSRTNAFIAGAAFTNNFAGASTTDLYAVDTGRFPHSLGLISPDTGMFSRVGPLDVNTTPHFGFDVSGLTGIAYGSFDDITELSYLHTIDLATGRASRVGLIGSGFFRVEGLAALVGAPGATPVPEPATMILLGTGLAGIAAKVRRRRRANQD